MKRSLGLISLIVILCTTIKSQSLMSNLDGRVYFGGLQSGTAGFTLGYEHLKPKGFWGVSFSYAIPMSFSEIIDLEPIEESTRMSTTMVSYLIKPFDIHVFFKRPIRKDTRDKWFLFWYTDLNYCLASVISNVSPYNTSKYYGPESNNDQTISLFVTLGIGFEQRFGEMAIYGYPAFSITPTSAEVGSYSVEISNSLPGHFSFNVGFKKYFAENFNKKFGKPDRNRGKKRKKRR